MRKIRIPKKLPLVPHPDAAAREYYRNLKRYADKYIQLMKYSLAHTLPELKDVAKSEQPDPRLDSIRMDTNIEKRISELFELVDREMSAAFSDNLLRNWAKSMVHNTNRNARKGVVKSFQKVEMDVEPLLHDKHLNPYFQNVIDENVGLIKSIPEYKASTFKNALVFAITRDMPHKQISEIIMKHIGKGGNVEARAKFLAVDQVGKLNAAMNQYRQEQVGGEFYFWEGSMDEREREDHKDLDGKRFSWDKPPITNKTTGARNHPGEDYRCRCRARMDISTVLGIDDFTGKGESAASIKQRAAQSLRVLGK